MEGVSKNGILTLALVGVPFFETHPTTPSPPFNPFSSLNCELKFSCNIQYFSEMNTRNRCIYFTHFIMGIDEHGVPKGDDVLP